MLDIKNLSFLLVLFCFSNSASAEIVSVGQALSPLRWGCISSGMVIDTSSSICKGETSINGSRRPISRIARSGFYIMVYYEDGGKGMAFRGTRSSCNSPNEINESTGVCENKCKKMEGKKLGSISFPEGTRDVVNTCANSCRAKSDLFFPAANPPYGVFTYTGDSCGGETGGGSTGGGETGGGSTGGGSTGGGSTGGGSTGGGSTGGGSTGGGSTGGGSTGGGGSTDGDGLTKAQLQAVLQGFFGKSGAFNAPDQGDGYATNTVLTTAVDDLKTEIDDLEEALESKLKQSPLKLGQMSFSDGSYESTTFSLSRWNVDVGFNLFSSLGSNNTNMIRTVILFIATLLAGFILLSSGRSKV